MRNSMLGKRTAVTAVAVAMVAVPLGATLATPARAEGPAVVDPMLTIFRFGATFGLPTGCQLMTAAGLDIASRLGAANDASPIVAEINGACDQIGEQGGAYVDQGKEAAAALSFINTYANPAIGQFAGAVADFGAENGELIAPFGPTVAGLGGTFNFFQGK